MRVEAYYKQVFVPGNVAVTRLRMAGLPIDAERAHRQIERWEADLATHEARVEAAALDRGINLKYGPSHKCNEDALIRLLYGPKGICGEPKFMTDSGKRPSTDQTAVAEFATIVNHTQQCTRRAEPKPAGCPTCDDPVVFSILKIRSLSRGINTYLRAFLDTRRSDGCCHPKYNFHIVKTSRLSAEDPPVHQIPETADPDSAFGVKSVIVPRMNPVRDPKDWDPRKHGFCFRWDIGGAEAAIRAAMLTHRFCSKPSALWEYLRMGKDPHARNAALIYGGDETNWKKGTVERDSVGKQTFFLKLFGGEWRVLQQTIWREARIKLTDEEAQRISSAFDNGDPSLVELYHQDGDHLARFGYAEDGYGRRRWIGMPEGVVYGGLDAERRCRWAYKTMVPGRRKRLQRLLNHNWHQAANAPTQSMNASDTLWMLALAVLGEYVELRVPPMWESRGLLFPEAAGWQMHEGPGPGGKPFLAWHCNTVHDSGWGDGAPGYIEPTAKLLFRRCTALPFDWRLEADVPYRIELKVGPDQANMRDYNRVAKEFGLEPIPDFGNKALCPYP